MAILDEVSEWQATVDDWVYVAGLVEAVDSAMGNGDWIRLRDLLDELERASPLRATRLGDKPDEPVGPPPEQVRERTNRLVHDLRDRTATPGRG